MRFLKEFVTRPVTTGAIAPSSEFLARAMVEDLGLRSADAVLEYGPGTGAFTKFILHELNPSAKFAAIELNAQFAGIFRRRYPDVVLFEDTVVHARSICDKAGMRSVDCIVSGLPWAAFSSSFQEECLDEMMRVLKPGGRFVTFSYVHSQVLPPARRFATVLPKYFSRITRSSIVWLNLPPAFVYRCQR